MDTLRVDICYRPLRLGWAIRRGDFASLREIFRISHTLWGGRFNPVIVVDDAEQAKHLAETFRVDVIWPMGDGDELARFPERFPHLINPFLIKSLVVGHDEESRRAQLLDVHSALLAMSPEEIRMIREKGFRIYGWQAQDPLADVLLMRLGAFPDAAEFGIDYRNILNQAMQPEELTLLPDRPLFADVVDRPTISYLSRYRMRRHYTTAAGWDSPGFYVGDAGNFDDLVTYWNLQASDIPLWFVDPNHMARYTELIPAWERQAEEFVARRPEHRNRIAVWARRDDAEAIMPLFGGRIRTFCRMFDHTWQGGAVRPPMMYFSEAQTLGTISRSGVQPRVSFALANKEFRDDRWFHNQHLVASVAFGTGLFGDEHFTLSPPCVPELNEFLARAMFVHYDKLRVEPERLGVIIDAADADVSITALSVADLFERIFDLAGFSAKPSNGGLIARQLITRLGGLQGARVFKIPGVRRLLRTHGPNASFTKKSALNLIGQRDPDTGARFDDHRHLFIEPRPTNDPLTAQAVFAYLVDKGLFRIGADLTCPACRLLSWVALDNLQHRVVCSLCGNAFDATRQLLDEKWAYRRSGLLGLEKNIQGAVPVVLTLQQLDANDGLHESLYSPSLDLVPKDGTPPLEVDFVWMTERDRDRKAVVIIGECKDRQDEAIDDNDIRNLRRVADALPRSHFKTFILLAKLSPFSEREIALARTLNGEHQLRVIMLTARELEPYHFLERTKVEFPDIQQHAVSPEDLALVTAQIYFRPPPQG
jgi:hypothetical protein